MKPLYLLLTTVILFFSVTAVAQSDKKTDFDFFGKGMNSYTIRENFYYGQMKIVDNDVDNGHTNDTYVDLDWKHWIGKGFGVGLKLDAEWYGNHPINGEYLTRDWSVSPELSWGKMLSDRFGGYITADVLLGQGKDIYKVGTNTSTSKDDLFGYGAHLTFPYKFSKYSALTFQAGYDYLENKNDNSKETENNFGFNIFLQDYLRCQQIRCDHSTKYKLSAGAYDQGSGFILSETDAWFNTGNSKQSYINVPNSTFESKYNNAGINLKGSYYIIDYLGVGAGLQYNHSFNKSSDNTFHYTTNSFEFDPEVFLHVPVDNGWRNLFAKGGGYFGSDKGENTIGTNVTTDKSSTSGFNAGIGYFAFFAEKTAVQTCIYYRSITIKDSDSDDKSKRSGLGISVGLAHSF